MLQYWTRRQLLGLFGGSLLGALGAPRSAQPASPATASPGATAPSASESGTLGTYPPNGLSPADMELYLRTTLVTQSSNDSSYLGLAFDRSVTSLWQERILGARGPDTTSADDSPPPAP